MSGEENVLVDTSVWIDYFKDKDSKAAEKLERFISDVCIYVPEVVIAELIQGAKTKKEVSFILENFDAFRIITPKKNTWFRAGKLSFDLKQKGFTIHLVDCYIAVMAKDYKCRVFTLNRHFEQIRENSKEYSEI
ncbi:MAG: PIN domain-containing protein [Candidatus Aminicenantes bacterium]